jgi:hypothetical protein
MRSRNLLSAVACFSDKTLQTCKSLVFAEQFYVGTANVDRGLSPKVIVAFSDGYSSIVVYQHCITGKVVYTMREHHCAKG